jgi:hypothetical protein
VGEQPLEDLAPAGPVAPARARAAVEAAAGPVAAEVVAAVEGPMAAAQP